MQAAWHTPWLAVPVLGLTQIMAWGVLFYTPVLIAPKIAAERGWSLTFAMSGFSLGLLVAALAAPRIGRAIDRFGGHIVMTCGALMAAFGLTLLAFASHAGVYLAAWLILGVAINASLYDAAFATLGRIFGVHAALPITLVTLAGGLASTVSWPLTQALLAHYSWQTTYLVYALALACLAAPLHYFALPRENGARTQMDAAHDVAAMDAADGQHDEDATSAASPRGRSFILLALGFAIYAFIPSAMAAHLLAILQREGLDAFSAVVVGAMFGPAQVAARLMQLLFGRAIHPLVLARIIIAILLGAFAILLSAGVSFWTAMLFAMLFGGVNGLVTIVRGVLPLAMFGPRDYGHLMGRLALPFLLVQALAPVTMAFLIEKLSDDAAMAIAGSLGVITFICLMMLRMPQAQPHQSRRV